jgi:hypothetical protein
MADSRERTGRIGSTANEGGEVCDGEIISRHRLLGKRNGYAPGNGLKRFVYFCLACPNFIKR